MMAPIDEIILRAVGSLEAAKLRLLESLDTVRSQTYHVGPLNYGQVRSVEKVSYALSKAHLDAGDAAGTIRVIIQRWQELLNKIETTSQNPG